MKRFALVLAFLVVSCVGLAAQDYTVTRTQFIPSVYYVGDKVEMRISLHSAFAKKMSVPQEIPQPSWGKLLSMHLISRENEPELRLVFISFAAGTRSLPPLNLGPVVLEGVNIFVTSTLGTGNTSLNLAPAREQVLIPGTILMIAVQILIILLIPASLITVIIRGRPAIRRFRQGRKDGLPYRRMQRNLKIIGHHIEELDARSFYIRIMNDTRLYLSDRLRISAVAATTGELEIALNQRVHHAQTAQGLIDLFRHGDRVKFAGAAASLQSRMADLHQLEETLRHIEQEERFRRHAAGEGRGTHVDL